MNSVLYIRNTKEFQSTKVSMIRNMSNDRYLFLVKIICIIANIRLKILRIFVILMIEIMRILIFVKVDTLAF